MIGDVSLFHALNKLAAPHSLVPLINLTGDGSICGSQVRLTPIGAEVLAGHLDRVALNGWSMTLGGIHVHVDPGGEVPRS